MKMLGRGSMHLILGLILLMWGVQLTVSQGNINAADWTRKEIGAVIHMTTEFVKDMDMKMRDVRRVERYYYGVADFGAGRIFSEIENKFEHMVTLYKNCSYILRIMSQNIDLRSDVVGSLQFTLSDYMEFLSLIDLFKERYSFWQTNSELMRIKDIVKRFLLRHNVLPYNYQEEGDAWRRYAIHAPAVQAKRVDPKDDTYDYIGFNEWFRLLTENMDLD